MKFVGKAAFLVMILLLNSMNVFAAEKEIKTLTVKEAVNMAVNNSNELKNLSENAYLNEQSRENIVNSLWNLSSEKDFVSNAVSLMQNEMKQAAFSKSEELQRQSIELSITKFFATVLEAERELELYDKNLELSKKKLLIAKAKNKIGQLSKSAYETTLLNYDKDVATRETKIYALNNAYKSLNEIMGQKLDTKYKIEQNLSYQPLPKVYLQAYISDSITNNPDIISKQNDVTVSEYELNAYSFTTTNTKESREIKVQQAKRALSAQKEKLESSITTCYNDIINLETQYNTSLLDYENMKKQLEIKETQLSLGKLTAVDVEDYKNQMISTENKIAKQINDHAIKVMQFNNPNLL